MPIDGRDNTPKEVERWKDENKSWYGVDQELTDYAVFVGEQMKNGQHPLATPGNEYAFCQEVKNRIQRTFPQKFQNPNRARTDIDESSLRGGDNLDTGTGKKGWKDLPSEARQQCTNLMAQIKGYSRERFIKDYFEGA